MNRRNFLQTVAGVTLASFSIKTANAENAAGKLKIAVFWEDDFPTVDGVKFTKKFLAESLKNHNVFFSTADELPAKLAEKDLDLFINPFGSAFPKTAWTAILKYLQTGGNLLNIGGKPFSVPVKKVSNIWQTENAQVGFHKRLGILQYAKVGKIKDSRVQTNIEIFNKFPIENVDEIYPIYPRLSNNAEFADESGSDGQRDANFEALAFRKTVSGEFDCAPIVKFDRLRGEFAGGRWVFVPVKTNNFLLEYFDAAILETLAQIASFGVFEYTWLPVSSTIRTNESIRFKAKGFLPANSKNNLEILIDSIRIQTPTGKTPVIFNEPVWKKFETAEYVSKDFKENRLLPMTASFYKCSKSFFIRRKEGSPVYKFECKTGFWVTDEKTFESANDFAADRHFLYRNGEPFPVVGTTYMDSVVHRRFLFEPNPAVWNNDFDEMKAAGVNMIRTGIWTGWRKMLDEKGAVREEILRAFEAFILTAKKYDIPVIFTFFAFMPEMFGGKNAYLDAVSIEAQKRFMKAFAERVKSAKDVIWDLINEPSFANPKALWSCRPNGDEFEKRAWETWLLRRYNAKNEAELRDALTTKNLITAEENPFDLPKSEDFDAVNIISNRRPFRAQEFRFFAQEIFKNWASEMSAFLKREGNAAQLVTVGQDEAGLNDSPAQQFHADVLDFTSLHNWWSNDDLLWDNVMAKSPAKPSMIQETGIMSYEKLDGKMWRTEQEIAELLERKTALALGANACGFIQWIWNTNPYMNIDNEAGIGFLRADKTEKPELRAFKKIADFANRNRDFFRRQEDEETVLVIPHSWQFVPRNLVWEATKKSVRAFHYHCRRTLRAVSEYNLKSISAEKTVPRLILVPSPRILSENAWQQLLKLAENGSTVAVTGCFQDDENFMPMPRMSVLGLNSDFPPIAVSQFENVKIEGKNYEVRFAGEKIQRVEKAALAPTNVQDFVNKNFVWCPIPLELGETLEPIAAFYEFVSKKAGISPLFSLKENKNSLLVRPTVFEKAILYTIVNESTEHNRDTLTHLPTKTIVQLDVKPNKTEMFFIEKQTGKLLNRLESN